MGFVVCWKTTKRIWVELRVRVVDLLDFFRFDNGWVQSSCGVLIKKCKLAPEVFGAVAILGEGCTTLIHIEVDLCFVREKVGRQLTNNNSNKR